MRQHPCDQEDGKLLGATAGGIRTNVVNDTLKGGANILVVGRTIIASKVVGHTADESLAAEPGKDRPVQGHDKILIHYNVYHSYQGSSREFESRHRLELICSNILGYLGKMPSIIRQIHYLLLKGITVKTN
jgi:hypothetical protein